MIRDRIIANKHCMHGGIWLSSEYSDGNNDGVIKLTDMWQQLSLYSYIQQRALDCICMNTQFSIAELLDHVREKNILELAYLYICFACWYKMCFVQRHFSVHCDLP